VGAAVGDGGRLVGGRFVLCNEESFDVLSWFRSFVRSFVRSLFGCCSFGCSVAVLQFAVHPLVLGAVSWLVVSASKTDALL